MKKQTIEQFEKETTRILKSQRKALKNIVELIQSDFKTDGMQLRLF